METTRVLLGSCLGTKLNNMWLFKHARDSLVLSDRGTCLLDTEGASPSKPLAVGLCSKVSFI